MTEYDFASCLQIRHNVWIESSARHLVELGNNNVS